MKTMAYFCTSPMPSHSIVSGIQVMEGKGRRREMIGSKNAFAGCHTPSTMPNGTEKAEARKKPTITRRLEASTAATSSPLLMNRWDSWRTRCGDGMNVGSTMPLLVAKVQMLRKRLTDAIRRIQSRSRGSSENSFGLAPPSPGERGGIGALRIASVSSLGFLGPFYVIETPNVFRVGAQAWTESSRRNA